MTERSAAAGPASGARAGALALAAATLVFVVVLIALVLQMRAGDDPALRAMRAPRVPPRRVLVRRVLERRVVVQLPADAAAPAASASQQVGAAAAFEGASPLTRTS